MRGLSESVGKYKAMLWAKRQPVRWRAKKWRRIADHRRNSAEAKALSHLRPEKCHGLVDASGKPFKYMMMTHDEAKRRNEQTSLFGYRWTLCTPTNHKEIIVK